MELPSALMNQRSVGPSSFNGLVGFVLGAWIAVALKPTHAEWRFSTISVIA